MNGKLGIVVSVLLLMVSLLANAWLISERTQLMEVKTEFERLSRRFERLIVHIGVLTVTVNDLADKNLPLPLNDGR